MTRVSPLPGGEAEEGVSSSPARRPLAPLSPELQDDPPGSPTHRWYLPGWLGGKQASEQAGFTIRSSPGQLAPLQPSPGLRRQPPRPPADQRGNVTRPTPGQAGRSVPRGPSRFGSSGAGAGGRRGRSVRGSCGSGSELSTMVRYPGNWGRVGVQAGNPR